MISNELVSILRCPECMKNISVLNTDLFCTNCKKSFSFEGGVLNLLPKNIEENKQNEDKLHLCKDSDAYKYNDYPYRFFVDLSHLVKRFERDMVPKIKGEKILELAAGNSWASCILKYLYPESLIVASDISPNGLRIKGPKFAKMVGAKPDIFIACDAERIPFADESLDRVFMIASLHHMISPEKVIKQSWRVLKPGGKFIAIDYQLPKWAQLLVSTKGKGREKYGIIERQFTIGDLKKIGKNSKISSFRIKPDFNPYNTIVFPKNENEDRICRYYPFYLFAYALFLNKSPERIKNILQWIFPTSVNIDFTK